MENLITGGFVDYDLQTILFNLLLSIALLLVVSYVYRRTHHGLSYSRSFNFSIVIIGLLITGVMMVIGSNIAIAFGALGAFSLVRFRTAVKDPKDAVFVFFSVVVGMAIGTGNYLIGAAMAVVVSVIILLLDKLNFGTIKKFNYILSFTVEDRDSTQPQIREVLKKYTKSDALLNATMREMNHLDMTFHILLTRDETMKSFVFELQRIPGVQAVNIVATKDDIEY